MGGAEAGPPDPPPPDPGSVLTSCSSSVGLAMGCREQRLISTEDGRETLGDELLLSPFTLVLSLLPSLDRAETASLDGILRPL